MNGKYLGQQLAVRPQGDAKLRSNSFLFSYYIVYLRAKNLAAKVLRVALDSCGTVALQNDGIATYSSNEKDLHPFKHRSSTQ